MIFISHGVLTRRDADRISHGLMLDEDTYISHLRRMRYVPLADALAGKGDALTFDDASNAAVRGALLARAYGQPVTLFANGWHVETRAPYFPYQLSSMLDDTQRKRCFLFGRNWSLRTLSDKRILRQEMKRAYLRFERWEQILALVKTVSEELGVGEMEQALHTAGRRDLLDAAAVGVDLQNHGWTHLNPQLYSVSMLKRDIECNQRWLHALTGKEPVVYAPPFGKASLGAGAFAENVLIAPMADEPSVHVNRMQLSFEGAMVGSATCTSSPQLIL